MLRRKFRPKMEETAGRWRRLHREEVNGFFLLTDIITMRKYWRMRYVGCETCVTEMKNVYGLLFRTYVFFS